MFSHAILRRPAADFASGLTTQDLGRPDLGAMVEQHARYGAQLERLGLRLEVLDPLPGYPDGYFVEDAAVVVPELAVVTRPGAPSRLGEAFAMAAVLARHRPLARIEPPGTLEGGDVMVIGREVFIGLSTRTNPAGAVQLSRLLSPHGYAAHLVRVEEGLHLKSSVCSLGEGALLLTARLAACAELRSYRRIVVDSDEAQACNALLINGTLLAPAGFPKARQKLVEQGFVPVELEMSEAQKMDGGLSCLSLRF